MQFSSFKQVPHFKIKLTFKVELFSCLVQNSIGRVEAATLKYDCNMAKQSAIIHLQLTKRIRTFDQILFFFKSACNMRHFFQFRTFSKMFLSRFTSNYIPDNLNLQRKQKKVPALKGRKNGVAMHFYSCNLHFKCNLIVSGSGRNSPIRNHKKMFQVSLETF